MVIKVTEELSWDSLPPGNLVETLDFIMTRVDDKPHDCCIKFNSTRGSFLLNTEAINPAILVTFRRKLDQTAPLWAERDSGFGSNKWSCTQACESAEIHCAYTGCMWHMWTSLWRSAVCVQWCGGPDEKARASGSWDGCDSARPYSYWQLQISCRVLQHGGSLTSKQCFTVHNHYFSSKGDKNWTRVYAFLRNCSNSQQLSGNSEDAQIGARFWLCLPVWVCMFLVLTPALS